MSSSSPDTTSLHLAEEPRAARINALHFIVRLLLTSAMSDDYDGRLSVDRRLVKLITDTTSIRSLARKSGKIIIKSLIKGKYKTKREARRYFVKHQQQKIRNAIRADVIRQKRARRAKKSSHRCNNQIVFRRIPILVGIEDRQERDWAIDVTGIVNANDHGDRDVFCCLPRKNNFMPSSSYDDDDGGEGVGARRMRQRSQQGTGEDDTGRRTQCRAERQGEDANDHGGRDVFCGMIVT